MKSYCITCSYTTYTETTVQAENEKEAKKKFKEVLPYDKVDEIWEVKSYAGSYA